MDKNGEKTGGRKKGTPDQFNATVKETVLSVFTKLGGEEGLLSWTQSSEANRRIFYSSYMKMLPREVHVQNGDSPDALPFRLTIEKDEA